MATKRYPKKPKPKKRLTEQSSDPLASEILDPDRHSLGNLGVALVAAARRSTGIDRLSEPEFETRIEASIQRHRKLIDKLATT